LPAWVGSRYPQREETPAFNAGEDVIEAVHTTAAGCEYLLDEARLDAADRVTLLTAAEPDAAERDAGDAANVATARLTGFCDLALEERAGDTTEQIRNALAALDPDVLLLGPHGGAAGKGPGLDGTARAVIETADVPVVVLPLEPLS
jgi:nucleotide-binding universal stress UspA family protein